MRNVMVVHDPKALSSKSYGVGPKSCPPTAMGSSAINWCLSLTEMCDKNGDVVGREDESSLLFRSIFILTTTWEEAVRIDGDASTRRGAVLAVKTQRATVVDPKEAKRNMMLMRRLFLGA